VRTLKAIHDAVLTDQARDDVAALVIATERRSSARGGAEDRAGGPACVWRFDAHDASAVKAARSDVLARLTATAASADECHAAEVVFGELVGNVVRHAPGPVEVQLELRDRSAALHVLDEGPGYLHLTKLQTEPLSENGRGLLLVSALSEEFSITRRLGPVSGSHSRAVLSVNRPVISEQHSPRRDRRGMNARRGSLAH